MKQTKITFSNHGREYSATLPWDANTDDCIRTFTGLMVAGGYASESILDTMEDIIKEHDDMLYHKDNT